MWANTRDNAFTDTKRQTELYCEWSSWLFLQSRSCGLFPSCYCLLLFLLPTHSAWNFPFSMPFGSTFCSLAPATLWVMRWSWILRGKVMTFAVISFQIQSEKEWASVDHSIHTCWCYCSCLGSVGSAHLCSMRAYPQDLLLSADRKIEVRPSNLCLYFSHVMPSPAFPNICPKTERDCEHYSH